MDGSVIKQEILHSLVTDEMVHDSVSSDWTDSAPYSSGTNHEDVTELKPDCLINNSAKLGMNDEIQNERLGNDSIEQSLRMNELVVIAPQEDNFGKCELFQTNKRPYSPDHQEHINQDTTIPAVKQELIHIDIKEEKTEHVSDKEIYDKQDKVEIEYCEYEEHIELEEDINCPWVDNLKETVKMEAQPGVMKSEMSEDRLHNDLIKSESMFEENTQPRSYAPDLPDRLPEEMGIILTDTGMWSTRFLQKGTEFSLYDHSAFSPHSLASGVDWTSSLRKSSEDGYNMVAEQCGSKIVYKLVTDIQPQTELILLKLKPINNINEMETDSATPCQELDTSMTTKQKHSDTKLHQCKVCGRIFTQKGSLVTHMLTHTVERTHQCIECGKAFVQRHHLVSHMLTHSGKKPHECKQCGKFFSQPGNLKKHMESHTKEKSFQCIECGNEFMQKASLVTHVLIHSGQKHHECIECGKSFARKGDLVKHMSTHSGEKPHECKQCGKFFSLSGNLKRHLKSHQ